MIEIKEEDITKMLVWDNNEEEKDAVKRYVVFKMKDSFLTIPKPFKDYFGNGIWCMDFVSWNHAKPIPEVKGENNEISK